MNTEKKEKDKFADTKKLLNNMPEEKLKDMDKDDLINLSLCLGNELKKIFKEIKKLDYEKGRLHTKLEELENAKNPAYKYSGYPRDKDFISKLLFILTKNETAMTFEDIVNAFFQLETNLDEKWRNPNKSISKIISRACSFHAITRKKMYGNNGYYIYELLK
jgi:hypothetical protein